MTKYWIGVASKDHVSVGVSGGFCQLCHGKKSPLSRMSKGDKILYYAPKQSLKGNTTYQKIVATGTIIDDKVYSYEMFPGFVPYRRNVLYENNLNEVSIESLRNFDEWNKHRSKLRFGHFEISKSLFDKIYNMMKAKN
jgi:hypothetical protein